MKTNDDSLVRSFRVEAVQGEHSERVVDTVAAEEPLGIRVQYWLKGAQLTQSLAVTMRTPGNDCELATGLLLAEGIVHTREDVVGVRPLGSADGNEVLAELAPGVDFEAWRTARQSFVSASCGICGKTSRDAIVTPEAAPLNGEFRIDGTTLRRLPERLRERQRGFSQTGGLHAAALVNSAGQIEAVFEDIGRHNALDKLNGWALLAGRTPLRNELLFLSSRSSFELIQKAVMAGAPVLATIGGPSSLAIETARQYGLTLVGFLRESRYNVYSGGWRIHSK